jgi:hypothetical protein
MTGTRTDVHPDATAVVELPNVSTRYDTFGVTDVSMPISGAPQDAKEPLAVLSRIGPLIKSPVTNLELVAELTQIT